MTLRKSKIPAILLHSKVNIKPLSVNKAWQGRRFKTPEYKHWEIEVMYNLPSWKKDLEKADKLEVWLEFGFSNGASDIDNPIKPTLDVLQKKYGFNDKSIWSMHIKKVLVPKGEDYVDVTIKILE
jgi:Holliday junction resolvase RusA-like endonuclease